MEEQAILSPLLVSTLMETCTLKLKGESLSIHLHHQIYPPLTKTQWAVYWAISPQKESTGIAQAEEWT